MSALGGRKTNQTGRATGRLKTNGKQSIQGQFIAHPVALIRSAAWGALGLAHRKILDRLEIEHAANGGRENGSLICTYDDIARAGVRRQSISRCLGDLMALGFIEITERGRMAAADFYTPSRYRLTYLNTKNTGPTNEWQSITTNEEAQHLLSPLPPRNIDSRCVSAPGAVGAFLHPEGRAHRCATAPGPGCDSAPGITIAGQRDRR